MSGPENNNPYWTPSGPRQTESLDPNDPSDASELVRRKEGCSGGLVVAFVVLVLIATAAVWKLANNEDPADQTPSKATPTGKPPANSKVGEWVPNGAVDVIPIRGADKLPTKGELPKGAVIYKGESGGEIGCIPCDGKFRVMSVDGSGVTKGGANGPEVEAALSAPLPRDGTIYRLGAHISDPDGGNWTVNINCKKQSVTGSCASTDSNGIGNSSPIMACSVPLRAPACVRWDGEKAPVKKGDRLVLTVGNPGEPATKGEFTIDWWFVFVPD